MAEINELNDSPSTVTNSNSASKKNLIEYKGYSKEDLSIKSNFQNETIIEKITETLEYIIEENAKLKKVKNIFYSMKKPSISIKDYLTRIQKYTNLEDNTLILSLIYIDRLLNTTEIELNNYDVHKLLFTAIIIAIKYNEDEIYNNPYYAKIGGISGKDLNKLEFQFLLYLDYNLFVGDEEFQNYCKYLYRNN